MAPTPIPRINAFALIVLLISVPSLLFAQNADKQLKKANAYFQERQYVEAEQLYKGILGSNPSNYDAAYRLGLVNTELADYREALQYYRQASQINPNRNDTVYFKIGATYKILNNYRKAKESFREFMKRHKTRDVYFERAELEIQGCDLAEAALAERPPFRVKEATFNSTAYDLFPSYLDQRQEDKFIVFTSHRPAKKKKKKQFSRLGQPARSDLFMVVIENDSTFGTEVTNVGKPINTKYNDGTSTFTGDGLTLYFSISNKSKYGYGTSIYESRYDPVKKRWAKPKLVPGINGTREVVINSRGKTKRVPAYDTQPFVTRDGRTMFFISDRDGGQGGQDVWFSRRVGNGWSEPINGGPTLNTAFDEFSPVLSEAGDKLYFASDGHPGFGGADLFVSEGQVGNWQEPLNLGSPVNSSYDDLGAIFRDQDSSIIFTSNRPGSTGGYDIFWGRRIHYKKPNIEISLHGLIRDRQTKQPIPFASAILYEITEQGLVILDTFETDQSARYYFDLEPGMKYKVLGNAPEYFANEIEVETPEKSADLERNIDIELEPIIIDNPIVLQNIYYDFDEYYLREDAVVELNDLVEILSLNPEITIQLGSHTDTNGGVAYNKTLSNNRARAAVRFLIDNGINPERITWVGFGKSQPLIYPERNDQDEQINRRTEFRVISIGYGE